MTANLGFSPYTTTNALGGFAIKSTGFVQGVAMDDPASRNYLSGGVLASTETIVMWGGVGIFEKIPLAPGAGNDAASLGPSVGRATSLANLTGFSVFNQAIHWLTTPQSQAPSVGSGGTVPFYRFGSNARIALQMDPSLIDLDGGLTTQQVSWDFVNQRLIPYFAGETGETFTAMSWTAGVVSATTAAAHGLVAGDDITVTGVVPAAYNGSFTVLSAPTTTTLTYGLPNGGNNPGAVTTQGSIVAGGGALNVRILETQVGNSKTVVYDPINNVVNFNPSGACALVLI